jgi:hypothetical protein
MPAGPVQYFRLPLEDLSTAQSRRSAQYSVPEWGEVQLRNDVLKVKVGRNAGGAITYISRANSNESVISRRDTGRLVQQSFYGNADGTEWVGKSWVWNPVQGGSVDNAPGVLLQMRNVSASSIGSVSVPRNWAGNQVMLDAAMETVVTLKSDHIVINNKMYYTGWRNQSYRDQEMPAVFLTRTFDKLWFYNESNPWAGEPLQWVYPETWEDVTQATATLVFPTEGWIAYQNSKTGEAVGIMSPSAVAAIAYRVGYSDVGGVDDVETSYVAPIGRFGINAGETVSYDVYVTLGTVEHIRLVFWQIHTSLMATSGTKKD